MNRMTKSSILSNPTYQKANQILGAKAASDVIQATENNKCHPCATPEHQSAFKAGQAFAKRLISTSKLTTPHWKA